MNRNREGDTIFKRNASGVFGNDFGIDLGNYKDMHLRTEGGYITGPCHRTKIAMAERPNKSRFDIVLKRSNTDYY